MGGTTSKNLVNIVNETSAQVVMNHMQNCAASTSQTQVISGVGFGFGINQSAAASIDLSCASNFKMDANIAADIANSIVQKAEASNIALLDTLRSSRAENILNITNRVTNTVTTNVVQTAIVNLTQTQIIQNSGVILGASQQLTSDAVLKAIMDTISRTDLAASIANDTSQASKSTTENPLAFLTEFGWMWIVIVVAILAAIVGLLWIIFD